MPNIEYRIQNTEYYKSMSHQIKSMLKWFIYHICICWRCITRKPSPRVIIIDDNPNYISDNNIRGTETTHYRLTDEEMLDML